MTSHDVICSSLIVNGRVIRISRQENKFKSVPDDPILLSLPSFAPHKICSLDFDEFELDKYRP